jgi:hypothetical protein
LKGINGLPSGHSNLNGSNPGLLKDFPRGILFIKMLSKSLHPKEFPRGILFIKMLSASLHPKEFPRGILFIKMLLASLRPKEFLRGILFIKMLSASLRPKEVEDKIAKDVKRLSDVGEASYMVPLDPGGVIFSLEDSFTQRDEWPGKSDVIGRSPFLPDAIEGLPSPFGEETVLTGFRSLLCANLARGEDPHAL